MKKSVQLKLDAEYARRLGRMPSFVKRFCQDVELKYGIRSIISYLKDYTTFFEFLITSPQFSHLNEISEFSFDDFTKVTKTDILDFMYYLSEYQKHFFKQDGTPTSQVFTNSIGAKARKLASLRVLYHHFIKQEIPGFIDATRFVDIKRPPLEDIKDHLLNADICLLSAAAEDGSNIESSRKQAFHEHVKARDSAIIAIFCFMGIRVSELTQIDLSDINMSRRYIRLIRKGAKKTRMTIPDEIIPIISAFYDERMKVQPASPLHKDAFFLSLQKKRIHDRTVRDLLAKYKIRTGIDLKITPHTLRRSFAMQLLDDTGDIQLTADLLGQKSTDTTRRHYAKSSDTKMTHTMECFTYSQVSQKPAGAVQTVQNPQGRKIENE